VLVDASQEGPAVSLRRIEKGNADAVSSTHFLAPDTMLSLAQSLYGKAPEMYVCSVRGETFEFGTTLSPAVEERAKDAVTEIKARLL